VTTTSPFEAYAAHFSRIAWQYHLASSTLYQEARRLAPLGEKQVTRSLFHASCVLADQHREALSMVAKLDGAAAWDMENRRSGAGHG
jgi:hypothetical protein